MEQQLIPDRVLLTLLDEFLVAFQDLLVLALDFLVLLLDFLVASQERILLLGR